MNFPQAWGESDDEPRQRREPEFAESPSAGDLLFPCWRCGKYVPAEALTCPVCRAKLREARLSTPGRNRPGNDENFSEFRPIKAMLWMFSILLVTSVVQAWYVHFGIDFNRLNAFERQQVLLNQLIIFEVIDSALLLVALSWAGTPMGFSPRGHSGWTWFLSPFVLAGLLGLNLLYHWALLEFIGARNLFEVVALDFKQQFWILLFATCVQPAVVEEYFFRYLMLGHLRGVMGDHAAVWVTAVAFGLAHIHVPLSIPILILVGVGIGYLRLYSGSMALPMLVHGLHNFVVMLIEGN